MPLMNTICFSQMECFPDYTFSYDKQKCKNKTPLSLEEEKKETFASAIFGKTCYVARAISRAGKLICLRA